MTAITGSTGKTSTKDILAALLGAGLRVAASPANLNTEVGLPLALLGAGGDVEVVVLEMAMRGAGQIALLTEIAEPDVGVIVNVGPAVSELLGSFGGDRGGQVGADRRPLAGCHGRRSGWRAAAEAPPAC